jgi:hypothetical protein
VDGKYKEMEKRKDKMELRMTVEIIWKTMEEILKEGIRDDLLDSSIRLEKWMDWIKAMKITIERLISRTIEGNERMVRKDHTEAAAVKGIKNPGKTVVATVGKNPKKRSVEQDKRLKRYKIRGSPREGSSKSNSKSSEKEYGYKK